MSQNSHCAFICSKFAAGTQDESLHQWPQGKAPAIICKAVSAGICLASGWLGKWGNVLWEKNCDL